VSEVLRALGKDADGTGALFITVDPERDTPAVMKDYLSSFDPHLRGATGDRTAIDAAEKSYRVYAKKVATQGGDYSMDHTALVYLMDKQGRFVAPFSLKRKPEEASPPICDVICSVDLYLREFAAPFQVGDTPAQLDKRGRAARRPVEAVFGLVPAERRMGQFDRRPPCSPRQQQTVQGCPRQNADLVRHPTEGQSAPGEGDRRHVAGHDRYNTQRGVVPAFGAEGYSPTESNDEDRVYQCDKSIPADHKKKGRRTARPKFMKQPLRLAHMDEEGLHPAFVCWFAVSRGRSLTHSLCWYISEL
jgi:hypothetical protein